jgi:hypothetical protein
MDRKAGTWWPSRVCDVIADQTLCSVQTFMVFMRFRLPAELYRLAQAAKLTKLRSRPTNAPSREFSLSESTTILVCRRISWTVPSRTKSRMTLRSP